MNQIPIWVIFISFLLLFHKTNSVVDEVVKNSLINFLAKLNGTTDQPDPSFGWNISTDPCQNHWKGVTCDRQSNSLVRKISLNRSSLSGVFDAGSICNVQPLVASLIIIKLDKNNIGGQLPAEIANCRNLTRLLIGYNKFSGNLPESLSKLNNLKRLDISNNNFSGRLPDLPRISGLTMFFAQYNQLTGHIPKFDFTNFEQFNISFNNFSGPIPDVKGRFTESSFMNNPELCGPPLQKPCPLSAENGNKSKGDLKDQILMYSGYSVLGFVAISLIICRLSKRKKKEEKGDSMNNVASVEDRMNKPSASSSDCKELSFNSAESTLVSNSMIVITSPVVNGLKFDHLLRAPAELLGRGKHGSLYKVIYENGMTLAVKRIKDWAISSNEFKQRMERLYQASHPNVLPALAFYCSKQDKLLVYEYQQNGSLFKFLHGNQMGQAFNWASRLTVAARIAEALAFMHQELYGDGIAHGNLKSSNILLNKNMEPCISEYGLMVVYNEDSSSLANVNGFKCAQQFEASASIAFRADIYGFGVILLELLTGKPVQNNGLDLTTWVNSVVQEEWTAEVFDKSLISEGASEQRMVNLLQVAIKCVNRSSEARPAINQVALMINTIREEEERSVSSEKEERSVSSEKEERSVSSEKEERSVASEKGEISSF